MKKKILALGMAMSLAATSMGAFTSCTINIKQYAQDDVVILFTSDVHCAVDDNIGYAGLAAYKKSMLKQTPYVSLVDCGDFSQGSVIGNISKGEAIIEVMNTVGYDYVTLGNHEFDFGIDQLVHNMETLNAEVLCCNVKYTGTGEDKLKDIKPYKVVEYGDMKVGFVGVTTPDTILTSTPVYFKENGEYVYDFAFGNNGQYLYKTVQTSIDECREEGADYVVLLSHIGALVDGFENNNSVDLIKNTTGVDAVLDGHAHVEVPCDVVQDKEGKDVLLSSVGTELDKIGRLDISANGTISLGYISKYDVKDEEVSKEVEKIVEQYESKLNEVIGTTSVALPLGDSDGIRMVRTREMPIGNFVADAFRWAGDADIGLAHGGTLRANLEKGDISYSDFIKILPFGNMICVANIKGSVLLDILEYCYRNVCSEYKKDGYSFGEDGSFQQLSGIKLTIDTSIPSSVEVDSADALVAVTGARRVSNVQVLENGVYVPLDPEKMYKVAGEDYFIKNGGCGTANVLKDVEVISNDFIADYLCLSEYMNYLKCDFSAYGTTQGRITIK